MAGRKIASCLATPHYFSNLIMSLQPKTTSEYLEGFRCKDVHCLESFYNYYSAVLFGIITRDIPDNEEAEKLLEEVICKIAGNISLCDPGERFFTWVILLTQQEIKKFISLKRERQKKIDRVIADLFFIHQPHPFSYTAS
jgi:DNA-directed RNA polymerase specialized sigma24 family protein